MALEDRQVVAPLLLFVIVVAGLLLRGMNSEERINSLKNVLVWMKRAKAWLQYVPPECQPFQDALRARTPRTLVTPIIVGANAVIVVLMLFGSGSFSDRDTLLAWGASFGPLTTNGEWWRLFSSAFVHAGLLHAAATIAGTLRVGLILERLVGPASFAMTYVAAAVLASLASLAGRPVAIHLGASGAVFGLYGLFIATYVWGIIRRSELTIPSAALRYVAPGAAAFLLYTIGTEGFVTPALVAGLAVGLICGFVLASGIGAHKPPVRRVLATMSATAGIVVLLAVPLRGVADVSSEIAHVVAVEDRTARDYNADVVRFKKGRLSSDVLIARIETIAPELRAVSSRLNSLGNVPPEHQWLVDKAKEYVLLRQESWGLRADALRSSDMKALQKADGLEHSATAILDKIRPADRD
jgi:membrane associated rhomboid family serine protease